LKKIIITIDGPAASGKQKIAKYISKKWGLNHLDSGILYRRLALIFFKKKINVKNINELKKNIKEVSVISFRNSKKIRTQDISRLASKIAIHNFVRSFVNKVQHDYVKKNISKQGFVIDGRDIGSVVFKNANLKLYIEVNPKIRAKRRYKQLIDSGEKSIYRKILKDIELRDRQDKLRKYSPLVIPKDAYIVDNSRSFKNTTKQLTKLIDNI
tara:strand:- start:1279 stop:1914 length:636 start_codon:yes stop_codon:yes gene_type:complete